MVTHPASAWVAMASPSRRTMLRGRTPRQTRRSSMRPLERKPGASEQRRLLDEPARPQNLVLRSNAGRTARDRAICPGLRPDGFEKTSGAHATADAHGHDRIAALAAPQLVQGRRGQLGPGAAQRMAQGDGAAVDVQLV